MPGHIKKSTGPDPDPSPWLKVSDEFRDRNKSKPYDPKKSCWVPNAKPTRFQCLCEKTSFKPQSLSGRGRIPRRHL